MAKTIQNDVYDDKKVDELEQVFIGGQVKPLDDIYTVEAAAMMIKELDEKVAWLKELKDRKSKTITAAITETENRVGFFRQVISKTMSLNDKKSISFPDSCQVTNRSKKGKWVVTDEDALMDTMRKKKKFDDLYEEVTVYKLDKKKLDGMLDNWSKSGEFNKAGLASCIEKEEDRLIASIKYEEPQEKDKAPVIEEDVPVKGKDEDYDSL
jgi:hypothetical protein